jgi:hypothetical protein
VRCGVDSLGSENLPDCGRCHRDAEQGEFAVDAPVAPAGVLGCQAQHEVADRGEGARTPGSLVHARSSVAVFDQVAMPAQHGVWADQEPESAQCRVGQWLEECCE